MKGYKQLTDDQIRALPEAYRIHLSVEATARALGCSDAQVRYALRKQGIALNQAKSTSRCYQNAETIRELAGQGLSFSEIGRRIGVKHQTVAAFLRRHDIPHTEWDRSAPENNPWWHGGRVTDKDGYILIHRPDHPNVDRHGYVREHRLVMEQELGRYLTRTEVVDHNDGNRANNDLSNLTLYPSNKEHLAATLAGRRPEWTEQGMERMRAPRRRRATQQHTSNPSG
jgi:hypothetical protein